VIRQLATTCIYYKLLVVFSIELAVSVLSRSKRIASFTQDCFSKMVPWS